jgi:fucose permease
MAVGTLLFILIPHVAITIPSAFVMGYPGTLLMIMVQAALADRHRERRAIALTESNIGASITAALAPLLVGSFQRIGLGWRWALVVGVLSWGWLLLRFRGETIPRNIEETSSEPRLSTAKLSPIFWMYWLVVFLSVSVEWSIFFWGADFLDNTVGLRRTDASTIMSVFGLAMVIGRTTGSRLTRSARTGTLLLIAVSLAAVGFIPFWLAPAAVVNIAGLFVAGLGVANLFPLTLSAASGVVMPAQADAASGRIALAAGVAILITPQVLGSLADQIGIQSAYSIVVIFLLIVAGAVLYANRLVARAEQRGTD